MLQDLLPPPARRPLMPGLLPILLLLAIPNFLPAQGWLRQAANAANYGLGKARSHTAGAKGDSSRTTAAPNDTITAPHHHHGGANPGALAKAGDIAPLRPVHRMPDGVRTHSLLKLESKEYIVQKEASLSISSSRNGDGYIFNYSIVSRIDKYFYLNTNKGRQGPVEQVPTTWLPAKPIDAAPQSNLYELRHPGADDSLRIAGHVQSSGRNILVDKKPVYTLQGDEMLAGFLLSPFSSEYFLVVEDKRTFVKALVDEKGEALLHTTADDIYATADRRNYIALEKDREVRIRRNDELKWRQGYGAGGEGYIFSDDGSHWVSVNAYGITFSEGLEVDGGILPVLVRNGNKSSLHFLQLTRDHEIIACSMDW